MNPYLHEIKDRGHRLTEELVKGGLRRGEIYSFLTKRMGYNFHYAQRNEPQELIRANCELAGLLIARRRKAAKKTRKQKQWADYKDKIFTDKKVLQEVGRRNTERIRTASLPPWRRWCAKIYSWITSFANN